jgi:probable rRNA maturation factor
VARRSSPDGTVELVVIDRQRTRRIAHARLRRIVAGAGRAMKAAGEVALLLTGDRAVRALNRRYRGKDKPTDVLSFPGAGGEAGLGDIVISVETAARNAREHGRTLPQELDILALHGFLHVLGYDHETDDGTMDRIERRLRRRLL